MKWNNFWSASYLFIHSNRFALSHGLRYRRLYSVPCHWISCWKIASTREEKTGIKKKGRGSLSKPRPGINTTNRPTDLSHNSYINTAGEMGKLSSPFLPTFSRFFLRSSSRGVNLNREAFVLRFFLFIYHFFLSSLT